MLRLVTIYFALANIITFIIFWIDKKLARRNKNRIPESTMILLSALGGAGGGFAAMHLFRHKTHKPKFFFTIPMLFVLHIIIAILIMF